MNRIRIGVRLESLEVPFRKALAEAAKLGVAGVQFDPVGELAPGTLSQTGRREVRHLLRTYNLELTALGCPLRRGLDVVEHQQERLEYVRQVMSLAWELGTRIIVIQAGGVPEKDDEPRAAPLREALLLLGAHADRTGVRLALETGLESGRRLGEFLLSIDTGGLGVNLDAANLLMHNHDVTEAVRALHGLIVHAHAKDARCATANRLAQEVPLGHGDLDWVHFLGRLEEIEYRGWMVVERETGNQKPADTAHGVSFLRRLLGVGD